MLQHLSMQVPTRATAMPRALLALFLCLFTMAAFADVPPAGNSADDSTPASPKLDKPNPATPAVGDINDHPSVAAPHATRPRIISPRWQSLLPGMIR